MKGVITYEGYLANGYRFHTKKRQNKRKTQNSGVMVKGDSESGGRDFYGLLDKVIVLEYDSLKDRSSPRVVLFSCKWFDVFDNNRGIKKDKFGSTLVNVTRRLRTNEPFALSSQIEQVFYVSCHNEPQWREVIKTKPRNYFDFPNDEDNVDDDESLWENAEFEEATIVELGEQGDVETLARDNIEPILVDANVEEDNDDGIDEVDEDIDDEISDEDDIEVVSSDGDSSVASFDRDLEEVHFDSDSSDDNY